MSRTIKGSKGCGYDYWSKRPYSGNGHGKQVKKFTHRAERVIEKEETQQAIEEMFEERSLKMKSVPFDVVQIYDNHCTYAPYTLNPIDEKHTVLYAVKIGNDFFPLGGKGGGVYLCDYYEEKQ